MIRSAKCHIWAECFKRKFVFPFKRYFHQLGSQNELSCSVHVIWVKTDVGCLRHCNEGDAYKHSKADRHTPMGKSDLDNPLRTSWNTWITVELPEAGPKVPVCCSALLVFRISNLSVMFFLSEIHETVPLTMQRNTAIYKDGEKERKG